MERTAQSGLEYLLSYGWALVLVATVVGVLVFVVTPSTAKVNFSSSSTQFLVKSSRVDSSTGATELVLQNATGGAIKVTGVTGDSTFDVSNATLNGHPVSGISQANPLSVPAGAELRFAGIVGPTSGSVSGGIDIAYTNASGLSNALSVSASGSLGGTGGSSPSEVCDNGADDDGDDDVDCDDSDCYNSSDCIVMAGLVIDEACDWSGTEDIDVKKPDSSFLTCDDCPGGWCNNYRLVFTDGPEAGNIFTITNSICGGCWDSPDCFTVPGLDTVPDGACGSEWLEGEPVGPPWYFNLIVPHS